jgi:hypothetical protein
MCEFEWKNQIFSDYDAVGRTWSVCIVDDQKLPNAFIEFVLNEYRKTNGNLSKAYNGQ